ncbi:hypothetical protein BaRGS_00013784 [Batillaria attramentaria]|uniref:Uncharacterized protein n=1 Tax=Batillaria attramentaria TaxID=370345 RepID=A0ABD0L6X8_9CAEN
MAGEYWKLEAPAASAQSPLKHRQRRTNFGLSMRAFRQPRSSLLPQNRAGLHRPAPSDRVMVAFAMLSIVCEGNCYNYIHYTTPPPTNLELRESKG